MKNEIKNWFIKKYVDIFVDYTINYKYLHISKNKYLLDYIEEKANELAKNEKIKIFNVSYDELNKYEKIEANKAVGVFSYLKNGLENHYDSLIKEYEKNQIISPSKIFPRIEITEKGDIFTILHELGHYFLYKRNETQSEKSANLFVEEFFDNYLPSFFKWLFQIDISVRVNKERKFSKLECYNYLKEYNNWKKNYESIKKKEKWNNVDGIQ